MGNVIKSQIVARDTKNILNYTTWIAGNTQATGFSRNGLSTENLLVNGLDPWGNETVLWLASPGGNGNADGGWDTSNFSIDNTKLYRFSVWVKRTVYVNGAFYLGLNGFGTVNGVYPRIGGALNTNPYFYVTSDPPTTAQFPDSTWILVVGHVWPAGSGTGSNNTESGLYTIAAGKYGNISTDFVWVPETTTARHRSYLYYSESNLPRQYWCYPRVDVVDGTEPTIAQLLGGYGALTTSALEKSNFLLGPSDNTSYFTTPDGGYYNAIIPPSGGYTIYCGEPATAGVPAKGPAMFVSANDQGLVTNAQNIFKTTFSSASEVLSWAAPRNNILIVNREYEPIVTNGLILNLDAGFTPSYPKTGTTWYDISGNGVDASLINGPTFNSANGGSVVFDGVNDSAVLSTSSLANNLNAMTVCTVVSLNWQSTGVYTPIVSKLNDIELGAGWELGVYYFGKPNGIYFLTQDAGGVNWKTRYTILPSRAGFYWIHVTALYYGGPSGTIELYFNGVKQTTLPADNGTVGSISTTTRIALASRDGNSAYGTDFANMLSGNTLIYNRALSADEVLQNYNAQKGRFGL